MTNRPQPLEERRHPHPELADREVILDARALPLTQQIAASNSFLPGGQIGPGTGAVTCRDIGNHLGEVESHWCDRAGRSGASCCMQYRRFGHYFVASLAGIASGTSPPTREDHPAVLLVAAWRA